MAEMAYAALLSLLHVLQTAVHPAHHYWIDPDSRKHMEILLEKVLCLMNILEDLSSHPFSSSSSSKESSTDELYTQIESICHAAEDIVESFVLDRNLARYPDILRASWRASCDSFSQHTETKLRLDETPEVRDAHDIIESYEVNQNLYRSQHTAGEGRFTHFGKDIQKVGEEMDIIEKKVIKIKQRMGSTKDWPVNALPGDVTRSAPSNNDKMVGFDDDLVEIMEKLTGNESKLRKISIVGMGGSGKTTLARSVYENALIEQRFDIRAWATISQEYDVRQILLALLDDRSELCKESGEDLGGRLYKKLCGMRYLIVMDDMWNIKVWEEVGRFFPDNSSGSRIMLTTRESTVARDLGSSEPYRMKPLDEDRSWNLFSEKAFQGERCPSELEKIGRKICSSCRGLPLGIVVIGGLLAKSSMTPEYWEYIAENVNSIVNMENNEYVLKLLLLSFSNLPVYLKPCFLYMASFREDSDIWVGPLIRIWVAEGFIKPVTAKSLEEVAKDYLQELINRNLISVNEWGLTGEVKSCGMHDLVRDLCMREACRGNFLHVTREDSLDIPPGIESKRRRVIHRDVHLEVDVCPTTSATRSLVWHCRSRDWKLRKSSLRLLRVLRGYEFEDPEFEEITVVANLRVMHVGGQNCRIASWISLFWNLQSLVVSAFDVILPCEIWEMPHLRHIETNRAILPHPPPHPTRHYALENLHTLGTIVNFRWTDEALKRFPNLKELQILHHGGDSEEALGCSDNRYCLRNLVKLHKLESLTCDGRIPVGDIVFPVSLKELTLYGLQLPWDEITIVGSLPNLEVLRLQFNAFTGSEWNAVEGQFLRLKYLEIEWSDLEYWRADHTHFPSLQQLQLQWCKQLEEIPLGFADTLRWMDLFHCKDTAVVSAISILEESEDLGNEGLRLRVDGKFVSMEDRY